MRSANFCLALLASFYCLASGQQCDVTPERRIDCHPDGVATEASCIARGCLWCPGTGGVPSCITSPGYGYAVESLQIEDNGYRVLLRRASTDSSYFGGDFDLLTATFTFESDYRLRVRIEPDDTPRFEVPVQIHAPSSSPTPDALFSIDFFSSPAFGFQVRRRSSGAVIFDTTLGGFTFADQFIQLAIKLPGGSSVYGIGENEQHSYRQNFSSGATYALYTRDQSPDGDANLYGVQPYYVVVEPDGNSHSVVILNSNAHEFALHPAPAYVYRTIGGILDAYIFLGPTPEETVAQFHEAIGKMPVPPYWALGFQLSKFGYQNLAGMQAAVDRTSAAGIPQDVQYADLDNLDRFLSFTYDPVAFAGLPEYIRELREKGVRFVVSTEAYISTTQTEPYEPYDLGNEMDVWVKRPDGTPSLAKTVFFQDPCHFADFSKNSTVDWWTHLITKFQGELEFDGLWLDMNEPAVQGSGDMEQGCDRENRFNYPPYLPGIRGSELSSGTMCPDAVHAYGLHYDTHSLFALREAEISARAMQAATGKRNFNLCRSNYLGLGQWAAHWLGDNFSNWANLRYSIIGTLQYNLFGIPLVGPDICGYFDRADEELCTRWLQVGAFYPFSRSHNGGGGGDHDPGVWGEESIASTRRVMLIRYTLLPYLYTLFYKHAKSGGTVARALWHTFPTDPEALRVDAQFMWGDGFLISPVLHEGATSVDAYFPAGRWYDYYEGAELQGTGTGVWRTLPAPFDHINLHLRGGRVLPTQEPAMNTAAARNNPYGLIIALDQAGQASGSLYLDDGESLNPLETGAFFELEFNVEEQQLLSTIVHDGGYDVTGKFFSTIRLLGQTRIIAAVIVNGVFHNDFSVKPETGEVQIFNFNAPVGQRLTVSWI